MADEQGEVLKIIEKRLEDIERKVLSNEEDLRKFQNESSLDTLGRVQKELQRLASKYQRISETWKKMKELEKFLSAEFMNKVALKDDVKADIVIAGENQLKECCSQLHEIEDMRKIISTEHLKDLPTWSAKMEPLIEIQLHHQEAIEGSNARLNNILSNYNNVITMLSKQFIEWDNILTRLEIELDAKPSD